MPNAGLCSAALVIFFVAHWCDLWFQLLSVKCRCIRSDAITGGAAASAASAAPASTGATFSRLTFRVASHAGRESVDRLWAALSTQNRLRHQLQARALNACYSSRLAFVSDSLRLWEETQKKIRSCCCGQEPRTWESCTAGFDKRTGKIPGLM